VPQDVDITEPVDEASGGPEDLNLGVLPDLLGYRLRRAQLAVFHDFYRACADHDIRPTQYSVLTVLRHNPGVQQSRVADALAIKRANFVALFAGLDGRGLVRRDRVASDRRAFALFLTPAGEALLDILDALVARHDAGFIARIGRDNQRALLDWLGALAKS
jgi:DNA-binding MarR family transcriptional regulator